MSDVRNVKRTRALRALNRRQVVGVLGSGTDADEVCCAEIGRLVASVGCDLLTGAGRGTMTAVSRAFFETPDRRGIVIGIVPGFVSQMPDLETRRSMVAHAELDIPDGYPNPFVELAIFTHLPDSGPEGTLHTSRNHINVLSADALIALAGGEGTYAEMWLAQRYGVPLIAYGPHVRVPPGITVERDIDKVEAFLRDAIVV